MRLNPEEITRIEEWIEEMEREEVHPEALLQLVKDSLVIAIEDGGTYENIVHDLLWLTGQR